MSTRSLVALVLLFLVVVAVVPAAAQSEVGRKRVGEIETHRIATAHPYVGGIEHEYVVHHPGATYVKIHFEQFHLARGDRLVVSNPDGTESYVFTDQGYKNLGENFWVTAIMGDTAILRLESINTSGGFGFETDYYAYGVAELFPDTDNPESVCGVNNWMDIECYSSTHPTEYDRARRAVVVLYNGVENCTGFKIGCPNQIMTNEHCVTSQSQVNVTEVRFDYQRSDCNSGSTGFSQGFLGDTFQLDNYTLDYSVFTVQGASDNYEAAELDPRLPPVGERIYISGHPAGSPKKLSIEDDTSPTGLCRVDISPTNGRGTNTDIGYFCDTTGGSSGSPVWSGNTHKVVGLHHFGGCANGGVRIDLIYPQIESILMSCCEAVPGIPTVSAVVNGDNRIDLTWDDSDLALVTEYELKRSRNSGGPYSTIATISDTSPGVAGGASYSYDDFDVSGGTTYYYTVESTDGSSCTSPPSAEASATATGACTLEPIFSGVLAVNVTASSICTLDVAWSAAIPECGGPVIYNVHRSTFPGFVPSGSNLIAGGLTTTVHQDINQLVSGQTYYYMVRAIDTATGVEDSNTEQRSNNPIGGCTTASSCPENPFVDVVPNGPAVLCQDGSQTLTASLTSGTGPFFYQWLRDGVPVPAATQPTFAPNDLGTHNYNVRVRADLCADEVFDGLETEWTLINAPLFTGVDSAVNPQLPTCSADLTWSPATTVCPGPIDYVIHRDTTTPVALTPANLVAGGVTGTSYTDLEELSTGQTYHYNVQARDVSMGVFDGNTVAASVLANGPGSGPQTVFFEDFEDEALPGWTVTKGPGAHNCGPFSRTDNAAQRPAGGVDHYLMANNECTPPPPLTSSKADSPVVDMTLAGAQTIILEADLRFDANVGEDLTVEAWDGTQWVVVWSDSNVDVDERIVVDITAQALGNSAFQARFSYQNAADDRFVSVDNVSIVVHVSTDCMTEAGGPLPATADSLRANFAAEAIDTIDVIWGTMCAANDYNLIYGDLGSVASYALLGSECSLGTSGSYAWSNVPVGNLYFLVVGTDGSSESSWGTDSDFVERNGSAASSTCGLSVKDWTGSCP